MPVSAKDWQLLREALEKHVRAPLKTWPEVGADWKKRKEYPREYPQRGRIATNSGLLTVLSYTLLYGCMHFDALCVLMRRQEFRVPLSLALAGSGDPAVLHVDFGCGPGTASWAVVNVLSDEARITTVGHDHNRHIIRLARKMTAHLARGAARGLGLSFHLRLDRFRAGGRVALRTTVERCDRDRELAVRPSTTERCSTERCSTDRCVDHRDLGTDGRSPVVRRRHSPPIL